MGQLRARAGGAVAAVAWMAVLGSAAARAQVTPQIVNGVSDTAEPTTAALVQGDAATGYTVCSAVLIGCDTAVTVAHCFNSNVGLKTTLFFQHAGFVPIESATQHPAYVDAYVNRPPGWQDVLRVEDITFLKLATPVSGVTPSTHVHGAPPAPGTPGWIVGFGRNPVTETSSFDSNAGIKRSGSMELSACSGDLTGFDVLCWEPGPLGVPGQDVSTCNVDSGGPLFVDESGTRVVAGLTKGAIFDPQGQSNLCLPPVQPYDTNVERHRAWIESMALATGAVDLGVKACGALPQLPEDVNATICDGTPWSPGDAPRTCGFSGDLGDGLPNQAQYVFLVPPDTTLMRVAFNGIASPAGDVDTNYYLRAGAPATAAQHDCGAAAAGNLGFCEIPAPAEGAWYVLVDQVAGGGEHQVTVTLLPEPSGPLGVVLGALLVWGCRRLALRRSTHRQASPEASEPRSLP